MMTTPHLMTAARMAAELPRRKRPTAFSTPAASLQDVAHLMNDGDLLPFSGRRPFSWSIRIATASVVSHVGLVVIGDDGQPQVGEVVEGAGGRTMPLAEAVAAHPGQWYWAPALRSRFPEYDGRQAAASMLRMVGSGYGYIAVLREAMWFLPILRELSYLRHVKNLDSAFNGGAVFCSTAVSLAATDGGVDPCPGRAPQWTTPQDCWQSWLWSPTKTALYP
ncbi:MAG: hypothetical protein AB7G28_26355 [Pirellulales bacterium]